MRGNRRGTKKIEKVLDGIDVRRYIYIIGSEKPEPE